MTSKDTWTKTAWIKTESVPGANPPRSYLFVGGPEDGKRHAVPDGSPTYLFAHLSSGIRASDKPSASAVQSGRVVYKRLTIGNLYAGTKGPTHTVYVFSHVEGLLPETGAMIQFEGRTWYIDDLSMDKNGGGMWFRAHAGNYWHTLKLTARLVDLVYQWDLVAWTFKPGMTVTVNEERTVVAP